MKKKWYLFFIMMFSILNICSSTNKTLAYNFDSLTKTRVEPRNSELILLLDSIIFYAKKCSFSENNQSFYFQLKFLEEDNQLKLSISGNLWHSSMTSVASFIASQEYFYYKGYLFLVSGKNKTKRRFFTKINEKKEIEMKFVEQKTEEEIDKYMPLSFLYQCVKGKFNLIEMKVCQ